MPHASFETRAGPTGIYTLYIPRAQADPSCISLINPEKDLNPTTSSPWGSGNRTTRFNQRGSRNEAIIELFGEVLSPTDGTKMGAIGGASLSSHQVLSLLFIFTLSDWYEI